MNDFVRGYLDSIDTPMRRSREEESYETLVKDFATADIEQALKYVLSSGLPPYGKLCREPLSFFVESSEVLIQLGAKRISPLLRSPLEKPSEKRPIEGPLLS